jgi:hypothetical protein
MPEKSLDSLPHYRAENYGIVAFEEDQIPCAFGGEPGRFQVFILVQGICQAIGISAEAEIERIQKHHLLKDGLYLIPFQFMDEEGRVTTRAVPAITLMRLHTWLAMIPPDVVMDERLRAKLVHTQKDLADVIYGYFGRRLLPEAMRAEEEPYLTPELRAWYRRLEEAANLGERVAGIASEVEGLKKQVDRLSIVVSAGEAGDDINADQQEQLKAMVDILSRRYEDKHGKGTRGALINGLKERHNWRFFNAVPKSAWPGLVQECVHMFRQMHPPGTPLPRVFELAQQSLHQNRLF